MTMITPSYLGETIEYSSLHACRSTLEDPTLEGKLIDATDDDTLEVTRELGMDAGMRIACPGVAAARGRRPRDMV